MFYSRFCFVTFLLPFCFRTILCLGFADIKTTTEDMEFFKKKEFNAFTQGVAENLYLYNANGNLMLSGNSVSNKAVKAIVHFGINNTECDKDKQLTPPHFDIKICFDRYDPCDAGIRICYLSELATGYVGGYDPGQQSDVECAAEYDGIAGVYHGIHITKSSSDVSVKVSFDSKEYRFTMPELLGKEKQSCFKIRMGSENSLAASITDMNNVRLVPTGDPPAKLYDPWNSTDAKNFWRLFIDFMPDFSQISAIDFVKKEIFYTGYTTNGTDCPLLASIEGPGVKKCKIGSDTHLICMHPLGINYTGDTEYECEFKVEETEAYEASVANSKSETSGHMHSLAVGAGLRQQWSSTVTETEINLMLQHTSQWDSSKTFEEEITFTKMKSKLTGKRYAVKTKEGVIKVAQYYVECAGYVWYLPVFGAPFVPAATTIADKRHSKIKPE